MRPEDAGYPVGTTKDLLRPSGNVMFHDGETVTLTIDLGRQRELTQVLTLSRQLVSFNGGCGISRLSVTVSDDNFANDTREFGELVNTEKLQDAAVPYAVEAEAPLTARYVRIVATPYTEKHNVYIDSISINGRADKSELAATGFHLNALEVADIDGDGTHEVFTGGTDKAIHGIGSDGAPLWRYEVPDQLNDIAAVNSTGRGDYQFVGACENHRLYSVNADGTERFTIMPPPRTYERPGYRGVNPFTSRLTVAFGTDIENDGRAEIVIGSANWRTYVFDIDGELIWDEVCWAHTPTCGDAFDLDGDGRKEVVMGNTYTAAVIYSPDGKVIGSGGGSGHAGPLDLVCADIDGNGKGEIIVGDRAGIITFQEWQGRSMPQYATGMDVVSVAVGDLEGDGRLETAAVSRNYMLYMFDADGRVLWNRNLLSSCRDVIIADVMGDAAAEVVCACEDGQVKVLDAAGNVVAWFQGGGWMRNVAACELDGNPATKELAVTCDDGSVYGLQVVE
jgi:outer membrane protein assembly factor BamB